MTDPRYLLHYPRGIRGSFDVWQLLSWLETHGWHDWSTYLTRVGDPKRREIRLHGCKPLTGCVDFGRVLAAVRGAR